MKIHTLITPSLLAAGLLLGMTPAVQADSGRISVILHDNDNTYDFGYRYGDYGYCCDGYYRRPHDYGHHYGHHKKKHWKKKHWHRGHGHPGQHGRHYGYYDDHKRGHRKDHHGNYRHDGHRQDRRHKGHWQDRRHDGHRQDRRHDGGKQGRRNNEGNGKRRHRS